MFEGHEIYGNQEALSRRMQPPSRKENKKRPITLDALARRLAAKGPVGKASYSEDDQDVFTRIYNPRSMR